MNKLLIFFAIVIFFAISNFASATDAPIQVLGTVPINFCITLKQTCANCTFVNISAVTLPNSSTIFINQNMTQNVNVFVYNFCQVNWTGDYIYDTIGNPDGQLKTQPVLFHVTPNGEDPTTPKAMFYLGLFLVLMVIFGFLMWALFNTNSDMGKAWWFSVIWLWMIAITFIAWMMANAFLTSNGYISGFFYMVWYILLIMFPFYVLVLLFYTGYFIYKDREVQKLVNRGFSIEDAEFRVKGGSSLR